MPPRVVIVGAGFGGLNAARALRRAAVNITLVDRNNYHLFQPLLYQVATAGLTPNEIAYPTRVIFRNQDNVDVCMTEVVGVDLDGRRLRTGDGEIPYDYLVLAMGVRTDFFGIDGVAEHGLALKDVDDAVTIRNHVLNALERAALETDEARRRQWLTIVVVGGGPTGVEMAGALAELIRIALKKDYRWLQPSEVRILLLEAAPRILPGMPEDLAADAVKRLRRKHVDVRLDCRVDGYDGERVRVAGGEPIRARILIWSAGVRSTDLAAEIGVPASKQGRLIVEPTLALPGHPEVFVVGDATYMENEGEPLPMMAPVAIQMGRTAGENIKRAVEGREQVAFRYKNPGSLATIGRNAAVAYIGGFKFRGFPAWVVWLVVHLMQLVGFRNRLVVLINWAWDYFLYERAVRLITRE